MPKQKVINVKSGKKAEFSGRRYQVQKRVYLNGKPLKDSSDAFGCETKAQEARKLMVRLIGEEIQNNRQSDPRVELLGENKAKVVCNSGMTVCFAVVAVTLPRS